MYQRQVNYQYGSGAVRSSRQRAPQQPATTVEVVHRYHISADPDIADDIIEQATQQLISENSSTQPVKLVIEKLDAPAAAEAEDVYAEPPKPKKSVQFGVEQTKYFRTPPPENRTGPMTVTVKVPTAHRASPAVVQHQQTPQQLQQDREQLYQQQQQQQQEGEVALYQSYPSAEQFLEYLPQQAETLQIPQVLQLQPQPQLVQLPAAAAPPHPHDMFSQIAQITDSVYLSSCHALQHAKLRSLGITHVVNATKEISDVNMPEIHSIRVLVNDVPSAQLSGYFDKVADKVDSVRKSGGRVLIHCVAGVSRSASLVIAYLMKYHRMSLREAYTHVKSRRAVIRPNVGFFKQLISYEKKLFGKTSVKMINSPMGLIPDLYEDEAKNMVYFNPKH